MLMLAQVLRQNGYAAETMSFALVQETLQEIATCRPNVLFISALPPFAISHARSLCRRTRQRCPAVKTAVGLWAPRDRAQVFGERLGRDCSDYVVHTLGEALLQLRLLTTAAEPSPTDATLV